MGDRVDFQKKLLSSFLEEWYSSNSLHFHTSGSTGTPKDIVLSRNQLEHSAKRTNRFFGINRRSRLHSAISFEYIGGKMMIVRSLVSGCELTYSEPSLHVSPHDGKGRINLMSVVPAQMNYIIDNIGCFSEVDNFLLGGSAIDDRLWDRISQLNINAWESYGMTETASHIAIRRITGSANQRPRFVPLKGVRLTLDEENCIQVEDNEISVKTNDIATLYPDGSFMIIGRRDDIIVSGGIKILPQDIEKIIASALAPLGIQYFISSLPDEIWTQRLVLVCVRDETDKRSQEYLRNEIRHSIDLVPTDILPKKKRPKEILFLPSLPLTKSGKLMRRFDLSGNNSQS